MHRTAKPERLGEWKREKARKPPPKCDFFSLMSQKESGRLAATRLKTLGFSKKRDRI